MTGRQEHGGWRSLRRRWRHSQPERQAGLVTVVITVMSSIALVAREALVNLVGDVASRWMDSIWTTLGVIALTLVSVVGVTVLARRSGRPETEQPDEPDPAPAAVAGRPDLERRTEPQGGPAADRRPRRLVLPPPPPLFVGRQREVDDLLTLMPGEGVVQAVITGRRGVGTSAFALYAAHRLKDRCPDGQLHLDLRYPNGTPVGEAAALRLLLRRLGRPEPRSNAADALDEAADALRSWLGGRRILFVFDNVTRSDQVRRLLPDVPGCLALVAAAGALDGLPNARVWRLDELTEDDAVDLLGASGDPDLVAQERAAAAALVNCFGRAPRAIMQLGRLIQTHRWPPQAMIEAVQESMADAAFQPAWTASCAPYARLGRIERRLLRLLAFAPAGAVDVPTAAAIALVRPARAGATLEDLVRSGLVESDGPGRYRLRPLLAASVRYHLRSQDSRRAVAVARLRMARYYARRGAECAQALLPAPRRPDPDRARAVAGARTWFSRENDLLARLVIDSPVQRPGLLAGLTERALWRLAVSLCTWYATEQRLGDWQRVCEAVLRMRLSRTHAAKEYWARNQLGVVHRLGGQPLRAVDEFRLAERRGGYRRGRAQVLTNLGLALLDLGLVDSALRHMEEGHQSRTRSDLHGKAISALALGAAHLEAGDSAVARNHLAAAARLFEGLHDQVGLAAARNNLGLARWEVGDHYTANEHWEEARRMYVRLGDERGLAAVLLNMGASLLRTHPDQAEEAVVLLTESLERRAGQPPSIGAGLAHHHLGNAAALRGDTEGAKAHRDEAERIFAVVRPSGTAARGLRRPGDLA